MAMNPMLVEDEDELLKKAAFPPEEIKPSFLDQLYTSRGFTPEKEEGLRADIAKAAPGAGVTFLASLGAGLAGQNQGQAVQNLGRGQDSAKERLNEYLRSKSNVVSEANAERQLMKFDEDAEKSAEENDPESDVSELARQAVAKALNAPLEKFAGISAAKLKETSPMFAKTIEAERKRIEDERNRREQAAQAASKGSDLKAPPGFRYLPNGDLEPIPGGPADIKNQATAKQDESRKATVVAAGQTVIRDIHTARQNIKENGNRVAGWGAKMASIPASRAKELAADIDSIKGNVAVDQLLKIKASGAGLGQVPQQQLNMLASLLGGLDQEMSPAKLDQNLADIEKIYADVIKAMEADPFELARTRGHPGDPDAPKESKPKTIIQNGITYTLNPKNGEYE